MEDPDKSIDLNDEIDRFEENKRVCGPFNEVSRLESKLLRSGEGYKKLKEIKKNPKYPFILSELDRQE